MNKQTLGSREPSSAGPRSNTSRVANELGKAIVSGKLPANSLLPKDAVLTTTYGVSRIVLREAVKLLTGKGLLRSKARLGTTVLPREDWNLFDSDVLLWCAEMGLDAPFIADLTEMRLVLEPEAAAFAARRRSKADLAALTHWLTRMGSASIDANDFVDADLNFHLAIAAAAGNPFFKSVRTFIEVALIAARAHHSPVRDASDVLISVGRHEAVLAAIAEQNPSAARKAMREVIRHYPTAAAGAAKLSGGSPRSRAQ